MPGPLPHKKFSGSSTAMLCPLMRLRSPTAALQALHAPHAHRHTPQDSPDWGLLIPHVSLLYGRWAGCELHQATPPPAGSSGFIYRAGYGTFRADRVSANFSDMQQRQARAFPRISSCTAL